MIRIERTHDMDLVRRIYVHPKIYGKMTDDLCPPPEALTIPENSSQYFLIAYNDKDEAMGVICYQPHNHVLYQIHIAILPEFWGNDNAVNAVKASFDWMVKNTSCRVVLSITPRPYSLAIRLAKKVGAELQGVLKHSILLKGHLEDQIIYGVNLWASQV